MKPVLLTDWTPPETAAAKQEELPRSERGFGKLRGCCLWRPLKLALLTHGWNPCTSATGGGKKGKKSGEVQADPAPGSDRNLTAHLTAIPLAQREGLACQEFQDTDSGLLEQLTTGQWPIQGMGRLSGIKNLSFNIRPILFLFFKRKLQSTPAYQERARTIYFYAM